MSYNGYVVTVNELREHSNADRLQIATFFGNDVSVGLNVKLGDVGVYFPTDGKLGKEFAEKNNLTRSKGGYLDDDKRHVKAISLRGEKSDGIYVPIESLKDFTDISKLEVGDKIDVLNGVVICEKYIPKVKNANNAQNQGKSKKKKVNDKELFPNFAEHVDTSQFAYNLGQFKEGDRCTISLKLHGTSARISNTIKKEKTIFGKVLDFFGVKLANKYEYVSGTRRVILKDFKGGFYGNNEFRKEWHDKLEGKLHKGETVYGEIVGYMDKDKLIMPSCNNKKTNDKEFIKKYGNTTEFTYGCENGESDFYVYRMTMTNEDGVTVEYPTELAQIRCEQMGLKHVPVLETFEYTTKEDLLERVNRLEDGVDPIGKTHIREGVIVRIEGKEKFTAFKQKNTYFKILEGIIKSDDILDIEEAEGLE